MRESLRWIALMGISALAFTVFLDFTIVSTALPFIKRAFDASILELQWVPNIFSIVLTATMVAAGRFADLHGRKKVFYWGVGIFGVAAVGAALSPTIGWLIFFRGLQGVGASILFVSSASLITNVFPKHQHGHAIGFYAGVTGLGLAVGPVIGGFLVYWLSWRWVFWVNVPLIAFGALFCLWGLRLPAHVKSRTRVDLRGLGLLVVGLGAFVYGIIRVAGERSWVAWSFLIGGIVLLGLFIAVERRSEEPLVNFSVFKKKLIALSVLSVSLAGVVSYVFMFFDPLYLEMFRGMTSLEVGLLIAAIPAAQVFISFLFPTLLRWFGVAKLMMASVACGGIAIVLHRWIGADTAPAFLILPFAALGINWGLSNAGMIAGVNEAIAPEKVGEVIGSISTVWNLVGSIFLALSSALFYLWGRESFLDDFYAVVEFNAIFALIVLGIAFAVYKKRA